MELMKCSSCLFNQNSKINLTIRSHFSSKGLQERHECYVQPKTSIPLKLSVNRDIIRLMRGSGRSNQYDTDALLINSETPVQ